MAHCVNVVDKAITMDNLRLLCLVVDVGRRTARRPRYKYSITARWTFCSRFIKYSRLNTQYLPSYRRKKVHVRYLFCWWVPVPFPRAFLIFLFFPSLFSSPFPAVKQFFQIDITAESIGQINHRNWIWCILSVRRTLWYINYGHDAIGDDRFPPRLANSINICVFSDSSPFAFMWKYDVTAERVNIAKTRCKVNPESNIRWSLASSRIKICRGENKPGPT